ncbi:MAG: hypothetical protein H0T76_06085 [Nannocystis sp.]|nr:hypothetical protein [Nannocystis sp.]MBA3546030.1 hypothetical protein [Nannocystis sp.]
MLRTLTVTATSLVVACGIVACGIVACGTKQSTTPPVEPTPVVQVPAEPPQVCDYLVFINAGSSGSRAYTYRVAVAEAGGLPTKIEQASAARVEPGLSSFAAEPAKAAESIKGLLGAEGGVLASIPAACKERTPVAVMATAGMRLLAGEPGGEAAANAIHGAVADEIKRSGLDLRFAGTISGAQEALYAWMTANYALGRLQGDAGTVGALDLGGASTQIAFEVAAAEAAGAPTLPVQLGGRTFNVYAQSYLGYGQDIAREHVAVDACYHRGLRKGTGKYAACTKALAAVLKPRKCEAAHCGLAAPNDAAKPGVAQPPLPAGMKFYAVSAYYFAREFFKLPEHASVAQLREAAGGPKGTTGYCGLPWKTVGETYPDVPEKFREGFCFSAAWIDALLQTYGFTAESDPLIWVKSFGEVEADWTLGAALCSVTGCLAVK